MTILAVDNGVPTQTSRSSIVVVLTDINEFVPMFSEQVYMQTALSNAPNGKSCYNTPFAHILIVVPSCKQ